MAGCRPVCLYGAENAALRLSAAVPPYGLIERISLLLLPAAEEKPSDSLGRSSVWQDEGTGAFSDSPASFRVTEQAGNFRKKVAYASYANGCIGS